MKLKNKYNIVVILCILLSFLTINLSSIGVSNSATIEQTIDYDNPNEIVQTNTAQTLNNTNKINSEDLIVLTIGIINVIVIGSLFITASKIIMKKKNLKEIPDIFLYIVIVLSTLLFVCLYIKMNNSDLFLTTMAVIDICGFILDNFYLKNVLKILNDNKKDDLIISESLDDYNDITLGQASEFGINNVISLKQDIYTVCNNINEAYMNFDKKELKKLCTKELYTTYVNELDELKDNNSKWIIEKLNYNNCKITSITKKDDLLIIKAILKVSMIDYLLKDEKVIKGFKNKEKNNTYELELHKSSIIRKALSCPSCGQSLKTTGSDKCPYCKQIIVSIGDDLVLNKKKKIRVK